MKTDPDPPPKCKKALFFFGWWWNHPQLIIMIVWRPVYRSFNHEIAPNGNKWVRNHCKRFLTFLKSKFLLVTLVKLRVFIFFLVSDIVTHLICHGHFREPYCAKTKLWLERGAHQGCPLGWVVTSHAPGPLAPGSWSSLTLRNAYKLWAAWAAESRDAWLLGWISSINDFFLDIFLYRET